MNASFGWVDALLLERCDGALGDTFIVGVDIEVAAIVAAIVRVQGQREHAYRPAAGLERKPGSQNGIGFRVSRIECKVVTDPDELGRLERSHELLGAAPIELVVPGRRVERRQRIEEVHRVDHLQSIPELAFQRRVEEITTVQDAHIAALGL